MAFVYLTARFHVRLALVALFLMGTPVITILTASPAFARPDAAPTGAARAENTPPHTEPTPTNSAASPTDQSAPPKLDATDLVVPLPPRPTAALAERAHTVLEKHCARCHQAGALQGRISPEGGIANILALDAIARNPALVRAGEPDSSPLYQQMIARQMPSDIIRDGAPGDAPDAAEIRAIRTWIRSLDGKLTGACQQRTPLDHQSIITTLAQWLTAIGSQRAADTRFISLAHLFANCATDAELAAYRQGVAAVLNSLTWSPKPVAVEAVGESLAILAVRLSDLGWTEQHWEELAGRFPSAARLDVPDQTRQLTGSAVPVIAGDWLAHEAMQPELYSRLLGLPPTLDDLARILKINLGEMRERHTVRRGVSLNSKAAGGPRVIERYAALPGVLWMAYDYRADTAPILDFPLLPWSSTGANGAVAKLPKLSGSQALFTLPNGRPAFMMFDEDGKTRLSQPMPAPVADDQQHDPMPGDKDQKSSTTDAPPAQPPTTNEKSAPEAVAKPVAAAPRHTAIPPLRNGLSCAACHALGPLAFEDHLAEHLAGDHYHGNPYEHDVANRIAFSKPELQSAIADDRYAVSGALTAIGADTAARIDGRDVMTGLAARYARDLDLAAAAAELLTPVAEFQASISDLSRSANPVATLATRLTLGRLTRNEFELLRSALLSDPNKPAQPSSPAVSQHLSSSPPSLTPTSDLPPPAPHTLRIWPDKISYNRNDRIVLHVSASNSCHLTLINIDPAGHATVLFPNEFSRDNLLKPHEVKRLPTPDALYNFRLQHPGTESFIAICEDAEPVPAGIRPDFTHMNFTELGDWEKFLDTSVNAAREPRVPLDNGDDRDRRRGAKKAQRAAPSLSPAQTRAAVTVTIAP